MPSKKKNTGYIDWDAANAKVKEFDRLHFTIGGIDVSKYYNPTNTVTVLDEYYGKLSLFFAEISKLFVTLENAIYREGNVGRNSLAEIQSILHQSVNSNNDHFKTTLGVETDVFQCRFIQKTVSEINNKNYLAKYLDEIISYEPNQLYDYNQGLLHSIKTIADIFTIPQKLFEYISPKFEHLIVGHIPFFDDLKLIQECPQILGTEKIINKLEEINKTIISTGTFAKVPTQPEETVQDLPINFDTAAAKYLALRELGLIENILTKFNGKKTKAAQFIAVITDEKAGTIKPFLSYAPGGSVKHNPETEPALNNAIVILNQLGLNNEVANLQNILSDKESKKETKKGNTRAK